MLFIFHACLFANYSNLDEEVSSVGDFTPELVIEAASRCLNIIQPNLDLPLILPANMAMRFKATAAIATACKVYTLFYFIIILSYINISIFVRM